MNQEQLQAIRERVNKATPGPWKWEPGEHLALGRIAGEYTICQFGGGRHWDEWKGVEPDGEDAEFIAHAREDVPALLDEIERLRGVCEVLRDNMHQALGGYMSSCPECRGRLPAHFDDCELRQALAGEST